MHLQRLSRLQAAWASPPWSPVNQLLLMDRFQLVAHREAPLLFDPFNILPEDVLPKLRALEFHGHGYTHSLQHGSARDSQALRAAHGQTLH